jgi:cytochrome b subunit of formate dehydrogenase
LNPELTQFRLELPDRCGNCHADLSREYAMSMHGELTELGYLPAAKCSDCHGSHEVLPISDPASPLSTENRLETCRKCHPGAGGNFLDFDPHADHTDPARDPMLHAIYVLLLTLIFSVFGFFGLHSILWFVRGTVEVVKHGRPRGLVPGAPAYVRFRPFHRTAHTIMLISFLGLALTGLPLKYSHYDWAKTLAFYLGGFESTSIWHRLFGVTTFVCFAAYMIRMLNRFRVRHGRGASWQSTIFGPDSPVPNLRDVRDFGRMARWFVGLGPKPTFERWSYWEKFDFWGACADIVIIGSTGLVLWFPNLFCSFLPGSALNLAKVIHSTQALLATGFVFAIHFFNAHFRAEKFPADMSVLTGLVSEEEMEEERPDFCERLRREGKLDLLRETTPSRGHLWAVRFGGCVALAIGLAMLAGMILAGLGK